MTNMINSQPRFGLEQDNGVEKIFDYATGVYHTIKDDDTEFESTDGVWNAREVATAIQTQQSVFSARVADRDPDAHPDDLDEVEAGRAARVSRTRILEHDDTAALQEQRADKVAQFKEDFLADGTGDSTPQRDADGLTEEERKQKQIDEKNAEIAAEQERQRQAQGQQLDQGLQNQAQNQDQAPVEQGPSGESHHAVQGDQSQQ